MPHKISAWPTAINVHVVRTDPSFNCTQSLTCEEREFNRTYEYDLKIYSSAVTPCRTNACISTASGFVSAMVWKWRQNFVRNVGNFLPVSAAHRPEKHGSSPTWGVKTPTPRNVSFEIFLLLGCYLLTYLLTYLLHGAESFLSSWLACS